MARRDRVTPDLFRDWQPPQVATELVGPRPQGGTLRSRLSRAVSQALGASGMTREQVAAAMSEHLGDEVSRNMLDAYASQARDGHTISLERFIALIEVTGQTGLLGFVAEMFGLIVVPAKYSSLIELHFIDEQMAALEARRAATAASWRGKR